ncbi:MAG: redoxin domain-containing protein [Candidatus Aminicenantes bacterium]|nr:redoxin domain-containing protein [Candidatus Aminicenantes bacterium]
MKIKFLLVVLILLTLFSFFWGYKNYQKFIICQEANQDLMKSLKEANIIHKKSLFLEEGEALSAPINFLTLEGQLVSPSENGTYLLIFISSTCSACLETGLEIYSTVKEFENYGLELIAISREAHDELVRIKKEENWPTKLAPDQSGQLHRLFNVVGVPAMVLLHQGRVQLKADALSIDRQLPRLKDILNQYLKGSKNDKNTD